MNSIPLLPDGDNPNLPKIIFFEGEELPPPHPEPQEPPKTFGEAMHDLGVAVNNAVVDLVVALEPIFKLMEELQPTIEAINAEVEKEKQAQRERAKHDVANQRRMQRGGKWKAF